MTAFRCENTALKERERERLSERGGKEGKGLRKLKLGKRVEGGRGGSRFFLGQGWEVTLKM